MSTDDKNDEPKCWKDGWLLDVVCAFMPDVEVIDVLRISCSETCQLESMMTSFGGCSERLGRRLLCSATSVIRLAGSMMWERGAVESGHYQSKYETEGCGQQREKEDQDRTGVAFRVRSEMCPRASCGRVEAGGRAW